MIYEYILIAFGLLVGLITKKTIMIATLAGLGLYLVWVILAVAFSFGRKYYKRCDKLTKFVRENEKSEENLNTIISKATKISSGLAAGIKTFKNYGTGFASNYISKSNALDSEVTGGIFNHGKSFMKAYIVVSTAFLFILNLAFLGADKTLTGSLLAEILILPFLYYAVIRLFYFLYTSTQQQFYKMDIDKFNELVDALDEKYGEKPQAAVYANETLKAEAEQTQAGEAQTEMVQTEEAETKQEEQIIFEQPQEVEEEKSEEPQKTLDDYDFFKKKNINVDKIVNEIPANSSTLPYIDVDSSVTPKDEGSEVKNDYAQNEAIFDFDNFKTENEQPLEEEKKPEPEKVQVSETHEESKINDIFAEFGSFEYSDNSNENKNSSEDTPSLSHLEGGSEKKESQISEDFLNSATTKATETESVSEINVTKNNTQNSKLEEENKTTENESDDDRLASLVGRFKSSNRPKTTLSESKQTRPTTSSVQKTALKPAEETKTINSNNNLNNKAEIKPNYNGGSVQPSRFGGSQMNSNFINMGGFGGNQFNEYPSQGGFNPNSNFYGGFNGSFGGAYSQPVEQKPSTPAKKPVQRPVQKPVQKSEPTFIAPEPKPVQANFNVQSKPEPKVVEKTVIAEKPIKVSEVSHQADEPKIVKPNALAATNGAEKGKRGRPAKQVFDENVTIKNDAEFEAVLSRAEKLMRKSEEGLSASQAKRVEKELKSLLDAMNRYKEGL